MATGGEWRLRRMATGEWQPAANGDQQMATGEWRPATVTLHHLKKNMKFLSKLEFTCSIYFGLKIIVMNIDGSVVFMSQ